MNALSLLFNLFGGFFGVFFFFKGKVQVLHYSTFLIQCDGPSDHKKKKKKRKKSVHKFAKHVMHLYKI